MKKLLLIALLFVGVLHAETTAAEGSSIRVTFRTIGLGLSRADIVVKQPSGVVPIVIESEAIGGESIDYEGPAVATLLRKVQTGDKVAYQPAGTITFPTGDDKAGDDYLVLVMPGQGGLRTHVIANDTASFPPQSVRVINALPRPAGVMVNKDSGLIHPGKTHLFRTSANAERIEVHIALQHREKWVEVNNNVYAAEKGSRRTIFLVNRSPADAPETRLPAIGFLSLLDRPKSDANKTDVPEDLGLKVTANDRVR